MQVDVTQVEALIADLHSVSRHTAGAAIKAGVQGILDDGKQKARDAYKGHPNKGFQYVGTQFTYDITYKVSTILCRSYLKDTIGQLPNRN